MSNTVKTIMAVVIIAIVVVIIIFAVRAPRRNMMDNRQADRSAGIQAGASITTGSPIDSDMNSIDGQMNGMQNDADAVNASGQ